MATNYNLNESHNYFSVKIRTKSGSTEILTFGENTTIKTISEILCEENANDIVSMNLFATETKNTNNIKEIAENYVDRYTKTPKKTDKPVHRGASVFFD